jgi:uncharacterized protein (TIGR03437 family)
MFRRCLPLVLLIGLAAAQAQPPANPIVDVRGVINFFTQQPAPSLVAPGSLVRISGLNLGPATAITATGAPWPATLGDVGVTIDGKPAPLFSVASDTILAEVPSGMSNGLVDVVVIRASGKSAPARVNVAPIAPAVRTAKDAGFGAPRGTVTAQSISMLVNGLGPANPPIASGDAGPTDTPAVPVAALTAYLGGIPAKVKATASTTVPGQFDVTIAVPTGARAGDIITLLANRQLANFTVFNPIAAPRVEFVPLPSDAPPIANLISSGLNGNFLLASGARDSDGCYAAAALDLAAKTFTALPDCFTSTAAGVAPLTAPTASDTIAGLIGPPTGDAKTGISTAAKIFSADGDPIAVTLPSPAASLTATSTGFTATLPGPPALVATIDASTGKVTTAPVSAAPGAGAAGATLNIDGLSSILASTALGQGRAAVIVADDPTKPTKVEFAIVDSTGAAQLTRPFPAGWSPLLTAVAPVRAGQTAAPAPPHASVVLDAAGRLYYVLARAADSSQDAFVGFALADQDPAIVVFPKGWFATSCTSDVRLFNINLAHQIALAASQVAESAYKAACPGSGFLILDLAKSTVTAAALPDQGQLRVPSTRTDLSMAMLNDYVYAARLDPTRTTISDTIYVLDGGNGGVFELALPSGVDGFTDSSLQQIAAIDSLLVQTINKTAGDQGFVLFDLDRQNVSNLPVPDGFDTLAFLNDGANACCLNTRNLVARALAAGQSAIVVYDLVTGDLNIVANPSGVTSVGSPQANAPNPLVAANSRANTVYGVAYRGNRQAGIIVIRLP